MVKSPGKKQKGFTLIELLISLAIGSLALTALYNFYISQSRLYVLQQQVSDMQQNARTGLDMMIREIRMAGFDPTGNAGAGIVAGTPTTIQVTFDLNEDGSINDANEDIAYALYDASGDGRLALGRKVAGGSMDPVADNFASLAFSYTLLDGTVTENPSAAELSKIRQVQVLLTSQTASPDSNYPDNEGYRTYTLKSLINLRNLTN